MDFVSGVSKGHKWGAVELCDDAEALVPRRVESHCTHAGCEVSVWWDAFIGLRSADTAMVPTCVDRELPVVCDAMPVYGYAVLGDHANGWVVEPTHDGFYLFGLPDMDRTPFTAKHQVQGHTVLVCNGGVLGRANTIEALAAFRAAFPPLHTRAHAIALASATCSACHKVAAEPLTEVGVHEDDDAPCRLCAVCLDNSLNPEYEYSSSEDDDEEAERKRASNARTKGHRTQGHSEHRA